MNEAEVSLVDKNRVVVREKNEKLMNGNTKDEENLQPPDGGTSAWMVMFGSFIVNGIVFGLMNSYSVLYTEIRENLQELNDTQASSKAGELFYFKHYYDQRDFSLKKFKCKS